MNLWPVEHFFEHICHGWVQQHTHPKVMANMLKKVFNGSEVHLSGVTYYKIHTLTLFLLTQIFWSGIVKATQSSIIYYFFYNLYLELIRKKTTFRSLFIVTLDITPKIFFISKIMYGFQFLPLFDDMHFPGFLSFMDVPWQFVRYLI